MSEGVRSQNLALTQWLDQQLQQDRFAAEQRHRRILAELQARLEGDLEGTTFSNGQQPLDVFPARPRSQSRPCKSLKSQSSGLSVDRLASAKVNVHDVLAGSSRKVHRLFDQDEVTEEVKRDPVKRLVRGHAFESGFATLILVNALAMAIEMQYLSYGFAYAVGMYDHSGAPLTVRYEGGGLFKIADIIFGVLFWIEVLLKVYVKRGRFLYTGWNCFDLTVMLAWTVDTLFKGVLLALNPTILRVCRLARVLRLVRLVRHYELFGSLVLMVSSIQASLWVLLWSTLILCGVMVVVSMIFNSMLSSYIVEGPDEELLARRLVFSYFGSFTLSMVTLFEITLGNWIPVCRTLMTNVTEWYGFAFILYKLFVGFAVLNVVNAIFLCETMKCASLDDELMIQRRERQRKKFMEKMAYLFEQADKTGDGFISRAEFKQALSHPRVRLWLQAMDFNIPDPGAVFDRLDVSGDGQLEFHELLKGMANLKGSNFGSVEDKLDRHTKHHSFQLAELHNYVSELRPDLEQMRKLLESMHRDTESKWRRRLNRNGLQHKLGEELRSSGGEFWAEPGMEAVEARNGLQHIELQAEVVAAKQNVAAGVA